MPMLGKVGDAKFNGGTIGSGINVSPLPLSTSTALESSVVGDSFSRFILRADGLMKWGGGSFAPDTSLYRSHAYVIVSSHKGGGIAGLAVGNSAAGNTLGSLVKKVEIFDENNNSLGFLPVYDAITQV